MALSLINSISPLDQQLPRTRRSFPNMAANSVDSGHGGPASNVENMFGRIISMLEQSVGIISQLYWGRRLHRLQQVDIAELKQECSELRASNANLERQVREQVPCQLHPQKHCSLTLFSAFISFRYSWIRNTGHSIQPTAPC